MRVGQEMRPPDNNYRLLKLNFCWSPSPFLVRVLLMFLVLSVMSVIVFNKLVPAVTGSYSSSSWSDPLLLKSHFFNIGSSSDVILTANETIFLHNQTFDDQLVMK